MDTKELLQAIGQMMDEKLEAQEKRTDEKFSSLRQDMTANNESLRQDMAAQEKRTDEKFSSLRQEMSDFREEMTRQNNKTRVLVENGYQRIENLLREEYGRVEGNAAKGAAAADSCKELRSTQADHTRALQNHNERITVLEEKAI